MLRRLVLVVLSLGLLAAPTLAVVPPPATAARPDYSVDAPSRFSPNRDGVEDELRVRYRVPRSMEVRLEISAAATRGVHRTVRLGERSSGTHEWWWNGRNQSRRVVRDGRYLIRLVTDDAAGLPVALAQEAVQLDTSFSPSLITPTFGAAPEAAARVFPRTTVVSDAVELRAAVYENKVASLRLVIRDSVGRVVRTVDVNDTLVSSAGGKYGRGRTVRWTARWHDEPLPKGRYTAVVSGRDLAGNTGRSDRQRIWVSADKLVWKEATTAVRPADSAVGPCAYTTANGCGDFPDCGQVVASTLYAGGLSYRSKPCANPQSFQSRALSAHLLEVPEATGVRGLGAVRVAFMGAPTTAGEPDTGTLRVWGGDVEDDVLVVGTAGQSPWIEDPAWGEGRSASAYDDVGMQRDPAAAWSFSTTGTDAVDVATFTVDVRYLVVAD